MNTNNRSIASTPDIIDASHPAPPPSMPSVSDFISTTFREFFKRKDILLPALMLFIISTIPLTIGEYLLAPFLNNESEVVSFDSVVIIGFVWLAVGILFSILGSFLLNTTLLRLFSGTDKQYSFGESFSWALRHIIPLSWIGFLVFLISMTGLILLIIPGIIFSLYAFFSMLVFTTEGRRGNEAIVRSAHLVKGAFWSIFGRLFVLWLALVVVCGIASTAVQLILSQFQMYIPFLESVLSVLDYFFFAVAGWVGTVGMVILFKYRQQKKPMFSLEQHKVLLWVFRVAGTLSLMLIFAFMLLMVPLAKQLYVVYQADETRDLGEEWYLEEPVFE